VLCQEKVVEVCKANVSIAFSNVRICANNGLLYDNIAQASCDNSRATAVFYCSVFDDNCETRCKNARIRDNGFCSGLSEINDNEYVCGFDGNWYSNAEQAMCVGTRATSRKRCSVFLGVVGCQSVCMGSNAVTFSD